MPVEFNKNVAGSVSDVEKNLCFELNFLFLFVVLCGLRVNMNADIITTIREILLAQIGSPLRAPFTYMLHL